METKQSSDEDEDLEKSKDKQLDDPRPKAPDGGWGWFVVFGCFLMHFLLGGFSRSFGVTYVELRKRFNSSAALTSMIGGVNVGLRFFCGPLSTSLSRRFSARSTVFLGGLSMGVSTMICGFMPNIYLLLLPYSIGTGIGGALIYSPGLVLVNEYFDKRRAVAAGIASSGSGLGVFLFPPLLELLFGHYGYIGAFFLLGAIMLNNCISAMLYSPVPHSSQMIPVDIEMHATTVDEFNIDSHSDSDKITVDISEKSDFLDQSPEASRELISAAQPKAHQLIETDTNTASQSHNKLPSKSWLENLGLHNFKNKPFLCYCAAMTLATTAYVSSQQLVIDFGIDLGIEESKAVFLLSIIGILDTFGRLAAGFVFDIPRIKVYRIFWYCAVLALTGSTIIATSLCKEYASLATICAFHGLFNGAVVSQRSVIMTDIVGIDNLSSCFGLCVSCQGVGVLIGPVVAGVLKDVTGAYTWSFVFSGCSCLTGVLILFTNSINKVRSDKKSRNQKKPVDCS